jgi:uncharacterized membrane protein YgdD (TMEM256/DUF423 family)
MEKRIASWSYWAGLVCVAITIILRALAAFGIWPVLVPMGGAFVSYYTFLRGSVMLLLLSIASAQLSAWRTNKT